MSKVRRLAAATTTQTTVAAAVAVATTTSRSERSRARPLARLALLVALVAAVGSCTDKTHAPADAAAAPVDLAPVPKPANLAATLIVSKPGETWAKLRETGGAPARLLPQSFGLLVSTFLGLPAAAADSIDPDVAMTGAALSDDQGKLEVAVAIHVRSGRELTARLSAGSDAAYSAREDAATGITLLEGKPGKASTGVALGVLGNYLLAARKPADLTAAGPYAARTLPKEPAPKAPAAISLEKRALSGPVVAAIRETWKGKQAELTRLDDVNRQKHGGRAPDFGDPRAALSALSGAIDGLVKVLESSAAGRVVIEPAGDRLELTVELDAEPQGAAAETFASLTVGDAEPIGALPALTPIVVLTRTTAASRQASAKSMDEGVAALLGDRLTAPDRDKVKGVLERLAQGRGDWETYGVYLDAGKGGLVYRALLTDQKAFDAGAKDLFKLLTVRALAEPLRQFAGETTVKQSTAQVPGVPGTTQRTLVQLKPSAMRAANDKTGKVSTELQNIELLWAYQGGRVLGAASFDAVPVLGALVGAEADPKVTHAGDPKVAAALARVKSAAFVVLLQPLRLAGGSAQVPPSPLVASFGRRDRTGFLRVEADQAALESVLKSVALGQ
ncbi:MAG: hypothetical protein HYZ29_33695 [Myxococcales bacterium]|nr:hypothetical protein [Myxococcales bacterium]